MTAVQSETTPSGIVRETSNLRPADPVANRIGGRIGSILAYAFLVIWAGAVVVPMVWAVVSAFKTDKEILTAPWGLPETLQFENFARAWDKAQFGSFFLNTLIVVTVSMVGVLVLGALAAFIIAKFDFPGRGLLQGVFVGSMTFPVVMALIPLFFLMLDLGLNDNRFGLILVYIGFGLPFTVFFLTAFFRAIPDELMEAARLDGCSYWGMFFRIMLPLARPGLISVGLFNFMSMWNQYILPLVLITDKEKYVLGQGVAALAVDQGYASDWSALFAGVVIAMLPVLFVYIVFSRQVQSGMTAGALKG